MELLRGYCKDQWSIRINDQSRICFRWEEHDAYDVEVTDFTETVTGFQSTLPKSHEHPKRALGRDRLLRCFAGFGPHAAGSPGEILRDDFIEPLGLSANALTKAVHFPPNRISAILKVNGTRSITADPALWLAGYLNTTRQSWMKLQKNYELEVGTRAVG